MFGNPILDQDIRGFIVIEEVKVIIRALSDNAINRIALIAESAQAELPLQLSE